MSRPAINHRFTFLASFFISIFLFPNFYEALGRQFSSPPGYRHLSQGHPKDVPVSSEPVPDPKQEDTVVFETNISNQNQSGMFVECDLVEYGDLTQIPYPAGNMTFVVKELNLRSDTVRNPWMSCRFVRWLYKKWSYPRHFDDYTPPRKPYYPFDPYYNVSLFGSRGNGSLTHVFLNDTGIFVEQKLLSQWGVTNESAISTDPGYKMLNTRYGNICKGPCLKWSSSERSSCMTSWHIGLYTENCYPRADYDITKYAHDGILTLTGAPCISQCEWGSDAYDEEAYECRVRRYYSHKVPSRELCTPPPGFTIQGEKCLGPCKRYNYTFETCPTLNTSSMGICSP